MPKPSWSIPAPPPIVIRERGVEFVVSRDPYRPTIMTPEQNMMFESILEPVPQPPGAAASSESEERFRLFRKQSDHSIKFTRAVVATCTLVGDRRHRSLVALWVVDNNQESLKNDGDDENFVFVLVKDTDDDPWKLEVVSTNPWRPTIFMEDVFDRLALTLPPDAPKASPKTPFVFFEARDKLGRIFSIMQGINCTRGGLVRYVLMSKKREPSAQEREDDLLLYPSRYDRLRKQVLDGWRKRNAKETQGVLSTSATLAMDGATDEESDDS